MSDHHDCATCFFVRTMPPHSELRCANLTRYNASQTSRIPTRRTCHTWRDARTPIQPWRDLKGIVTATGAVVPGTDPFDL